MSLFNKIISTVKSLVKKYRKYNANSGIDKKLLKYINYKEGLYIELGAYDGIDQSNTYYLEKYKGWNGILIEPSKNQFIKLKKNRGDKNFFFNCACDDKFKKIELIESGLITQNKKNIHKKSIQAQKILENKKTFIINAKKLEDLISKTIDAQVIDFLSLDVEGMELNVLKSVDHKKRIFKFILVESEEISEIEDYLKDFNYKLIDKLSVHDYLFRNMLI